MFIFLELKIIFQKYNFFLNSHRKSQEKSTPNPKHPIIQHDTHAAICFKHSFFQTKKTVSKALYLCSCVSLCSYVFIDNLRSIHGNLCKNQAQPASPLEEEN